MNQGNSTRGVSHESKNLRPSAREYVNETLIDIAEHEVLEHALAKSGDVIAITSGMPVGERGINLSKLHMLT
jgi:pyruvate kinase